MITFDMESIKKELPIVLEKNAKVHGAVKTNKKRNNNGKLIVLVDGKKMELTKDLELRDV